MKPNNLSDYLEISAKTHSARTALSGDEVEFRYDELLEKGKALAVLIENQFGEKSNPVMVKVSNHPMDFVAFLAVWLSGNVVVPVHRTAPPGVVEAIQRKARCQLSVDLTPEHTNHTLESLATLDPEPIGPDPALEAGAIVIFTSGSTGHPKGVVLTHTALLGKLAKNQLLLNIGPDDRSLLILNNTFVFGIWFALLTLLNGGCVFTRSRFDPKELVETLVRNRITHLALVPTMVRSLFGSMDPNSLQASQDLLAKTNALRCAILGGEALSAELSIKLRSVLGSADIYDAFGLTETCGNDFVLRPEDYSRFPNSIGTATAGVQYRIVNEDGVEVGPNEVGELQLRTPYLMSGYLGDPEITEAAFIDGWFKTGDLVTENREHYVTIVGRLRKR